MADSENSNTPKLTGKFKKKKYKGRGRPPGDTWQVTQPECLDLIMAGIEDCLPTMDIVRKVEREFELSHTAARQRVDAVWKRLAEEAGIDKKVSKQKIGRAILGIYRAAKQDMGLATCIKALESANISDDQKRKLLYKWDPYKWASLSLKALDQYARLCGLNSPEQVEVKDTTETLDPLTLTPQQRRARITELLQKQKAKGKNDLSN